MRYNKKYKLSSNKYSLKETLQVIILVFIAALVTYNAPDVVRTLVLSFFIFLFIRSKNNVVWIVFFFLYLSAPLQMFYGNDGWFFFVNKYVGFNYSFAISFGVLAKIYFQRNLKIRVFRKEIFTYMSFIILLLIWGMFIGHNSKSIFYVVQFLPLIILVLYLPKILKNNQEFRILINLLYNITIILFAFQTVEILIGEPIIVSSINFFEYEQSGLIRNISAIYFIYFTLFVVLSEYFRKNTLEIKELIVLFSIILMIINSGTRGWIISSLFVILASFFFLNKVKLGIISISIFVVFTSILFVTLPHRYQDNITLIFERTSTVVDVIQGDLTARGTLSRITERGPRVMKKFGKNPALGFGFSKETTDFFDGHVGNQSILLQSGIFGFIILYIIILSIIYKLTRLYNKLSIRNSYKYPIGVFIIGFFGIIIIHFSSQLMYGYQVEGDKLYLLGMCGAYLSYLINNAYQFKVINKYA